MADKDTSVLPPPSAEQRRVAAGQFERANQVIATGNYDYGIKLLLSCCKLDPANLIYRQALRRTEKTKYQNNLRGHWLAWLTNTPAKARIKKAMVARDYLAVLELGERVLTRNPWDVGTQRAMAEAAEVLGLLDLAVWNLEQARQKSPRDSRVNRTLARLYERRGNFAQAIALWELVRKADPRDVEAANKSKDLAASDTIARGHYEAAIGGLSGKHLKQPLRPDEDEGPDSEPAPKPNAVPKPAVTATKPVGAAAETSAQKPAPLEESASPAERRTAREAVPIQARIDADPTNPNHYLQLAGLYRRAGLLDQARSVLFKGVEKTGNDFEVASELADLEIEPFRQNLSITEERLAENPDDELRRIRVRLLKEINTRELDLFRQRADRYPADMAFRFELGVRLLRAGQVDEAIRELQAARSDPRLHWRCQLYLGHSFKTRNNWRLARRNFEEALQSVPTGEDQARRELFFQLAQGCADAGDLPDAINYGNELANLDFSYRDIGRLLDQWQTRLEQGHKS
jgi:tetratricopeptide (TPR) repeat protein